MFRGDALSGYRGYDRVRARALVDELGGLRLTLGTIRVFAAEQVATELQSQWRSAGIDVTIKSHDFATLIQDFQSGEWNAMLQQAGSFDPEAGPGIGGRFRSTGTYSGVRDAEIDRLLTDAAAALDHGDRQALYTALASRISDEAYAPFLFADARAQLTVRGVSGPGLTTRIPAVAIITAVLWHDVKIGSQ
jgi:peptide/nickel transport system substrate-binding protein